ncbi:small VCP/p97-interacting protein-like [Actinia tenebrosa]|uniref:Small VCP/p97-interacting protein-like n=1 Tax=Actinia tenebrosa TaxID=6105 RepID=A0A6P8HHZ7_ACTTE|nr:small VCP/p97-interacting protein-like [Actinia tenebrosa]
MGNCYDCLSPQEPDTTPDPEIRRQQQIRAAEQRQKESDARGVKDPERLKRQQKKREDAEKTALTQGQGEGGLKWTVG